MKGENSVLMKIRRIREELFSGTHNTDHGDGWPDFEIRVWAWLRFVICFMCMCALGSLFQSAFADYENPAIRTGDIWIEKSDENGLGGDILLSRNGNTFVLYLPGNANVGECCLSWSNIEIMKDGTPVSSGFEKVPPAGQSADYELRNPDGTVECITVQTLQGSPAVLPVFISISHEPLMIDGKETVDFALLNDSKKANASKTLISAGIATINNEDYYISLKGRGNSSWQHLPQKSFNLKFYDNEEYTKKKKVELIDEVETNKYTLISSSTDGSLLRNKLGYDLAYAMGIGVKCRFAEMWVDGEYRGFYLLSQKNDAMTPKGGYAIEYDNRVDADEHQLQMPGLFGANGYGYLTVKENDNKNEPDDANGERGYSWIDAYLTRAWDALRDSDSERYQEFFDLESWAKYYILEEFVKDHDSYGNTYMYLEGLSEANDDSVKLRAGPLWDMDHAFGNVYGTEDYNTTGWYVQNRQQVHFWLDELDNHVSFLQEVERQRVLWSDVFLSAPDLIADYRQEIKASAEMHMHRWPYPTQNYWSTRFAADTLSDDGTFYLATKAWDAYVDNVMTFVTYRADYVCNTPIVKTMNEENTDSNSNSFLFNDTAGHWAAGAIAFTARQGVLNGTGNGCFRPDEGMTRGMITVALWRMANKPAAPARAFADVDPGSYYADSVAWAAATGIVAEEGDVFSPDRCLTREELAVIMYKYAMTTGASTDLSAELNEFSDGDSVSEWAFEAMKWSVGNGLLKGRNHNILDPTGTVTRAEAAAILQRYICGFRVLENQ